MNWIHLLKKYTALLANMAWNCCMSREKPEMRWVGLSTFGKHFVHKSLGHSDRTTHFKNTSSMVVTETPNERMPRCVCDSSRSPKRRGNLRNISKFPHVVISFLVCSIAVPSVFVMWLSYTMCIFSPVAQHISLLHEVGACNKVHVSCLAPGSMPLVGSSSITISEPPMRAMARDSLRF
uniref:Uncharacterized protein n=1 Tax=Pristionchus pacificus TaxID=54126 RepID=A0A2A6CDB6_PRIPA|eukprot:PDM76033.1 hypothetical protein PRIPAC_39637 [Pristionchus pacificus]